MEAQQCAEDNGVYAFLETSAKTGKNVHEAFISAARGILARNPGLKNGESIPSGIGASQLSSGPSDMRKLCC
ncbi:unnamed protein product [Echinostoma caproni]|uniref:Ras-related protein Rab-11A n=1 Tax=Echinostoma caproni TaxID=27848 RepID=A0A183ATQ4_9TREM|nr:unnamed protein product [Echinostoma caproni]